MEHYHLEDRRGDILCGAKFGMIVPSQFIIDAFPEDAAGPLCPSCLDRTGDIQERGMVNQDAAEGMDAGELCLDCDGTGQDLYYRGPADSQECSTCSGTGRVGL